MLSPFVASLVLLAGAPSASPEALLRQGIDAFERLDDAGALVALKEARAAAADRPELLARIYVYEGLVWALRGDEKAATDRFRAALIISPGAQLPPGNSPRVQEWWKRAGGTPPAGPDATEHLPTAPKRLPGTALSVPREFEVREDVPRQEAPVKVLPTPAPGDLVGGERAGGEPQRTGSRRGWVLVPAAVGVGAAATSVYFFLDADRRFDEVNQTPGLPRSKERLLRAQGERSQLYGLLAAGGAGAAAVTSVVLWSVLGGTVVEGAPRVSAGPTGDGGAGVSVTGVLP